MVRKPEDGFPCDVAQIINAVYLSGIHVDYPNDEGQSPLFCACYANSEKVVEFLLSSGANPNE